MTAMRRVVPDHLREMAIRRLVGRTVALLAALVLLAGCTQTRHFRADEAPPAARGAEVLVVEPDVELAELLASGIQEPRADWTQAARSHLDAGLATVLAERGVRTRRWQAAEDPGLASRQRQHILLHEAVGTSILIHRYANIPLPNKGEAFDWTLGPDARALDPEARYALFVYVRDSYASAGRKAMLALTLLGVGVQLGQQIGFASLVDLDDGRVVWFNLMASATGDLRNADDALASVRALLEGAPL
jgi:hypothetical protein